MIKVIRYLPLILVLAFPAFSFADTHAADNCSLTAVQAAINAASDNDTVTVPAGTCTWSSALNVTKRVTLTGVGPTAEGTIINYGGTNHTLFNVSGATTSMSRLDISGFWLIGGDADYWNGTAMQLYGPAGWKNLRVHNMVFDNNNQWTIKGGAHTYGLIDNCTFKGSAHGIMLYGQGNTDWTTALTLGTDDFFFIENNTFDFDNWYGSTGAAALDLDSGGRVVFRFNTLKYSFFETHDKARSGLPSGQAYEIYNNTFWSDHATPWKAVDIAGGTGVIYSNEATGAWSTAIGGIDYKTVDPRTVLPCDGNDPVDQNTPGETGWRCQYQIGTLNWGDNVIAYPLYLWSNTRNGLSTGMGVAAGSAVHVVQGRDYFNNGSTPKPDYTAYTYPHPLTGSDAIPSAFSFTDITGSLLSTVNTTSPCVTVAGIDAGQTPAITISGTGCTYNVDGAAYTANAGTVGLDNVVCQRGTSSASYSTTYPSCTLTIGGVNDSGAPWTVTTQAAIADPAAPRMRPGKFRGRWR